MLRVEIMRCGIAWKVLGFIFPCYFVRLTFIC
jgi:hypothetical protein